MKDDKTDKTDIDLEIRNAGGAVIDKRLEAFSAFLDAHVKALDKVASPGVRQLVDFALCLQMVGTLLERQPFLTVDRVMHDKFLQVAAFAADKLKEYTEITDPGREARFIRMVHREKTATDTATFKAIRDTPQGSAVPLSDDMLQVLAEGKKGGDA